MLGRFVFHLIEEILHFTYYNILCIHNVTITTTAILQRLLVVTLIVFISLRFHVYFFSFSEIYNIFAFYQRYNITKCLLHLKLLSSLALIQKHTQIRFLDFLFILGFFSNFGYRI